MFILGIQQQENIYKVFAYNDTTFENVVNCERIEVTAEIPTKPAFEATTQDVQLMYDKSTNQLWWELVEIETYEQKLNTQKSLIDTQKTLLEQSQADLFNLTTQLVAGGVL